MTDPSTRQCPAPPGQPVCGWLEREVFRQYTQVQASALVDPRTPHSDEAFEQSIEFLKRFARERAAIVRAYIASVPPDMNPSPAPPSSDSLRYPSLQVRRPK